MKQFAHLFSDLDETNKTNEKINVLKRYFASVSDEDKIHTLALFTGRKPKRQINVTLIKLWATELSKVPQWLFEESYHVVGDLSETIALLLPNRESTQSKSLAEWITEINRLGSLTEEEKKKWLVSSWLSMSQQESFVFNKILLGSFRIGVSQNLIVKAISEISGLESSVIMHRIMGNWEPLNFRFNDLIKEEDSSDDASRPYPFYLAYAIQETSDKSKSAQELGEILLDTNDWQAEWKWDGIRAQAIKRAGNIYIWTRGEDLATDKFPELHPFLQELPDGTVLDGEAICFTEGKPMPFNILQTRIGRKKPVKKNSCRKSNGFYRLRLP